MTQYELDTLRLFYYLADVNGKYGSHHDFTTLDLGRGKRFAHGLRKRGLVELRPDRQFPDKLEMKLTDLGRKVVEDHHPKVGDLCKVWGRKQTWRVLRMNWPEDAWMLLEDVNQPEHRETWGINMPKTRLERSRLAEETR